MKRIKNIVARWVVDSRGRPTVEADVILENNVCGRAIVPSGASTGKKEALELRDADKFSVNTAVKHVNTIIKENIVGMDASDQLAIDNKLLELDGTDNKSKLGANAILAVSLAVKKAAANSDKLYLYESLGGSKLPRPMMNVINGGAHAANSLSIQEFMIVPNGPDFKTMLMNSLKVFDTLKKILESNGHSTNVGDEGGFAPNLANADAALTVIMQAITEAGFTPGTDFELALDTAASEFFDGTNYKMDGTTYSRDEMVAYYVDLVKRYPIISLEDPFDEDDYQSWANLTESIGKDMIIVGDDLFVTNVNLLQKGIDEGLANAILVKVNQIGTLTESINAINLAKANGFKTVMSHRSGETEDITIAHLAVGLNCDFIKTGSLSRGERTAKYNELLRIEERIRT